MTVILVGGGVSQTAGQRLVFAGTNLQIDKIKTDLQ